MAPNFVRVQRLIKAPASRLFDIVADPAMHPVMDGSGSVRGSLQGNPERLSAGARFRIGMRIGIPYRMGNTVTEFEEPHRIAWQPRSGHTWRYVFEEQDDGTLVTEEWDARDKGPQWLISLLGFRSRNRPGMERTLERLAGMVEQDTPTGT